MRLEFLTELLLFCSHATDRGLMVLLRYLTTDDPRLVRGEWGDDDAGCIVQILGRHHPACGEDAKDHGYNFLVLCGIARDDYDERRGMSFGSYVVNDFDLQLVSNEDIARVVRAELRARRAQRNPQPKKEAVR